MRGWKWRSQGGSPDSRRLVERLGLDRSDGNRIANVLGLAASGQIVNRSGETLQYRSYGGGASKALDELVSDIAGIEIRKNKHVSAASNRASR